MARHNWTKVFEIIREVNVTDDWPALARAVAARTGHMPRTTLLSGIERELGRSFATPAELLAHLNGDDSDPLSPLANAMLELVRGRGGRDTVFAVVDLSNRFDRSPSSVLSAAEELRDAGYYLNTTEAGVVMPKQIAPSYNRIPVEVWTRPASIHRYGLISDTHLGNRCARLDVANALYDIFQEEGIETVLHGGNLIDGECRFNTAELIAHGVEGQIAYAAKHYPRRKGITTRFLSADDHEGWWAQRIGFDIGRHMESQFHKLGRTDLMWLGHMEVDLELDPDNPRAVLRIIHPGGGSSYATSYQVQKFAESWTGGEKPSVALYGHYHKAGWFYPREVHCFLMGTAEDQTMWMRKKKLAAHVGGWIIEIHITEMGGVGRVKGEFFPFYDRKYYHQDWSYSSMFQ
jgi:predicted phosphodiesterase